MSGPARSLRTLTKEETHRENTFVVCHGELASGARVCLPRAIESRRLGFELTGQFANTGRYYRDTYQFAVDKINSAGGVQIGGAHEKLSLKILDNQSDVNLSVRQYVQLVTQDKVNFLLGPFASDFALADSAISEKYNIPMIQGGGASDQIYSRGYKYIFGTLPSATNYFQSTIADGSSSIPRRSQWRCCTPTMRSMCRSRRARASCLPRLAQGRRRRALQLQSVGFRLALVSDQEPTSMPCWSRATRPRY